MSEKLEITLIEKHPHRVGVVAGRFFPGSRRAVLRPPGSYMVERVVAYDRAELVRTAASGPETLVARLLKLLGAPPPKPAHRPKGSGQYVEADAPFIAQILARPVGEKRTTAARRLAPLAAGGVMVGIESRAKRLARAAKAEEQRRAGQ